MGVHRFGHFYDKFSTIPNFILTSLPLHFFRKYKIFKNTLEIDIFFENFVNSRKYFRKKCQFRKYFRKFGNFEKNVNGR